MVDIDTGPDAGPGVDRDRPGDGPDGPAARRGARHRRSWWRIGTPAVIVVCGGLFVVSAQSSDGTDLRPGRYDNLAGLTQSEANRAAALQDEVADLNQQVAGLTDRVDDDTVRRYQALNGRLAEPAGVTARRGPGVVVTLSDAPSDLLDRTPEDEKKQLVVHQQDIQAVVNAMWAGGAQAVTVQGQRVIATTGIKCEGNSVVLQGVPYPAPYVVSAVGDVGELSSALADDSYLQLYREQSDDPAIDVGWELAISDDLRAPAYDGVLSLSYATAVKPPSDQPSDQSSGRSSGRS